MPAGAIASGTPAAPPRRRWPMVWLVFAIAATSFLDRSNISVVAPLMKRDLGLSDVQLGTVFSAFLLGYAAAQPIAGRMADRFGAYVVIGIGLLLWSLLCVAAGSVRAGAGAMAILVAVRLILGLSESVIFPAAAKIVTAWVPPAEHGLATGLIFSGAGAGAGIAPPLVTAIMLAHGWRAAFFACGGIGLVAMTVWILFARDRPGDARRSARTSRARVVADLGPEAELGGGPRLASWRAIVGNRDVALLAASYFCFGYVAWIFFAWLFSYLSTVRGLDLKASGAYAILPFAAMAIASPLGGWISDRLAGHVSRRAARCYPAALGMALAALFVWGATQVAEPRLAAVVLAAGSGALYLSQSAFWTISAKIGEHSAGSVGGFINMTCQIGGAVVAQLTPVLAGRFGWSSPFAVAAAMALAGAACWLLIDPDAALAEE